MKRRHLSTEMTGLDIDSPEMTIHRKTIIRSKAFLEKIYEEWYAEICKGIPQDARSVLELGSGPGFMSEFIPDLITSDVLEVNGIMKVEDARKLSFIDSSLDAIVMTDVLHHIPDIKSFLREAERCLRIGGRLVCIEPWRTPWSQWIYQSFHHEPFDPLISKWELPEGGPLSIANGALPWMVLERDRTVFEQDFPKLSLRQIRVFMPLSYLLSGGFSYPGLIPVFCFKLVRKLERFAFERKWGMFAYIEIERVHR